MPVIRRAALAGLFVLAAASAVRAADGAALGVDAGATAKTGKVVRTLTVGADLDIGDRVDTDGTGLVQIRFADNTELVVGPHSSLVLEDYLLRSDGSAGKLAINALAGTFRFVTGTAPKDRYEITTPTGTIGVRGTAFDFNVTKGETSVLLYHGAATLCSRTASCVTLDDVCEVGRYQRSDSEIVGLTGKVSAEARRNLRSAFRYADSQTPLLRSFRVRSAENCLKQTAADVPREVHEAALIPPAEPPPVVPPPVDPPPVEPPPVDPPPVDPPPADPPPVDPPPHPDPEHDHNHDGHADEGQQHGGGNGHHGGNGHGNGGNGHGNKH